MNNPQILPATSSQKSQGLQKERPADETEVPPRPTTVSDKTPAEQTKDDMARQENEGGPAPVKDKDAKAD